MTKIYHIVLPDSWEEQKGLDHYEHESLRTEGFIHCSYPASSMPCLAGITAGAERVLILHIDPELLTSKLVGEASTGGEIYPHIYGKINREAIVEISERTGIV